MFSNLVLLHRQMWLLRIQVTTINQDHNSTHNNSTIHDSIRYNRTPQETKFHLHIPQRRNSSIQLLMTKQNSSRMKWLERQNEMDDKHIRNLFYSFFILKMIALLCRNQVFIKYFVLKSILLRFFIPIFCYSFGDDLYI